MPIKFVGGTFQCFINFRNRITLCINGVCLEFLWKFLSHNSKKLRRGTFLFFRIILVSKNCLDKRVGRGGGVSKFSVKKILYHSAEKVWRKSFSVSSSSGIEILYEYDGYVMIFCRRLFVSPNRRTSQGNPSEFQKVSGIDKNLWIRKVGWVEYHELPSETFCLTVPKNI